MNEMNTVLMMILCVMIGFAIGNVYGQNKIKSLIQDLITRMVNGLNPEKKSESQK